MSPIIVDHTGAERQIPLLDIEINRGGDVGDGVVNMFASCSPFWQNLIDKTVLTVRQLHDVMCGNSEGNKFQSAFRLQNEPESTLTLDGQSVDRVDFKPDEWLIFTLAVRNIRERFKRVPMKWD